LEEFVKTAVALLIASASLVAASTLRADVIYQDNFDGTAGDLAGRAVPVASGLDGGTAGATWNAAASSANVTTITTTAADAAWTATGGTHTSTGSTAATIGALSTGADSNLIATASLPFTPQAGFVYDLHAAIEASSTGASGNWLGVTFAQAGLNGHTPSGSASALSNDNPYGLLISKGTGAVQDFAGLGTANGSTGGTVTAGQFNSFDIFLDTTGAAWKVAWGINLPAGSTIANANAGTFTYSTNPSIGLVVIGSNKLTGAVSDFSLTAVPEPASLSLLSLAALPLLKRRR
jgi:hypothetical protein